MRDPIAPPASTPASSLLQLHARAVAIDERLRLASTPRPAMPQLPAHTIPRLADLRAPARS